MIWTVSDLLVQADDRLLNRAVCVLLRCLVLATFVCLQPGQRHCDLESIRFVFMTSFIVLERSGCPTRDILRGVDQTYQYPSASLFDVEMLGRSRLLACKCVRDIVIGIESDLLACNCVRDIVIWIGSDLDTNDAASFVRSHVPISVIAHMCESSYR